MKRAVTLVAAIVLCASCSGRRPAVNRDGALSVVVLGDSVAHGAGDESGRGIEGHLRFESVVNYGINGARTYDALRLLGRAPAIATASAVIVSIGGNDLYGDPLSRLRATVWPSHAMRMTLARVGSLVSRVHELNPDARVILLGLYNPYPRSSASRFLREQVNVWDAMLIRRFASDTRVTVIRIADIFEQTNRLSPIDHFHPSAAGYAAIAARIAQSF